MTLLDTLLALGLLFPEGRLNRSATTQVAVDVIFAVEHEGPIAFQGVSPEKAEEMTARLVMVMGYEEGRWQTSPKGSNDSGQAFGVCQVHKLVYGTPAEVRSNRILGFREGIASLKAHIEMCSPGKETFTPKDLLRGIAAYGSGSCTGWQQGALARCQRAGVCK